MTTNSLKSECAFLLCFVVVFYIDLFFPHLSTVQMVHFQQ